MEENWNGVGDTATSQDERDLVEALNIPIDQICAATERLVSRAEELVSHAEELLSASKHRKVLSNKRKNAVVKFQEVTDVKETQNTPSFTITDDQQITQEETVTKKMYSDSNSEDVAKEKYSSPLSMSEDQQIARETEAQSLAPIPVPSDQEITYKLEKKTENLSPHSKIKEVATQNKILLQPYLIPTQDVMKGEEDEKDSTNMSPGTKTSSAIHAPGMAYGTFIPLVWMILYTSVKFIINYVTDKYKDLFYKH